MTSPPSVTVRKARWIAREHLVDRIRLRIDLMRPTYTHPVFQKSLYRYFQPVHLTSLKRDAWIIANLTKRYLNHSFDLLGSGWVHVRHGMVCAGVEGHVYRPESPPVFDPEGNWLTGRINDSNLSEASRMWRLIDPKYIPIDWHLDFKSGFRWREATWYRDIRYGHKPGVDVKVPWEISRMQHLPLFSLAYGLAQSGEVGFAAPEAYLLEFRNQVLDFMATAPPRFGVNWNCTMDVAIRAANQLAAYDLFRAYGAQFDQPFEGAFFQNIYNHGRHIVTNLEYQASFRANHYLSDIVGLLFVAAYLPRTEEIDAWLAFAVQEFLHEMELQFHEEGTNFEASTSYHRLASELTIYATALILGLSPDKKEGLRQYNCKMWKFSPKLKPAPLRLFPYGVTNMDLFFPPEHFRKVERMAEFTMAVTHPGGEVVQIGDNDNGRLFKFQPCVRSEEWKILSGKYINLCGVKNIDDHDIVFFEQSENHRHLVAAINGLLWREDFLSFSQGGYDENLVRSLANQFVSLPELHPSSPHKPKIGTTGVTVKAYPRFGLYIFCSDRIHLTFRCGPVGQNGNGGHAHNDQLSLTLTVDGAPILIDPGTYLYTPFPTRRNTFRSTRMHNTIATLGVDQNETREDALFSMPERSSARLLFIHEQGCVAEHTGFGPAHRRELFIAKSSVRIIDICPIKDAVLCLHLMPGVQAWLLDGMKGVSLSIGAVTVNIQSNTGRWRLAKSLYSPAYGWLEPSLMIIAEDFEERIEWIVET